MQVGELTEQQMERIKKADKLHKFGALETWQELFVYQLICNDMVQKKEIGNWASRKLKGENIKLPLKENGVINN